eukprot:3512890-Amphidinium_carterae.1
MIACICLILPTNGLNFRMSLRAQRVGPKCWKRLRAGVIVMHYRTSADEAPPSSLREILGRDA